MSVPPHDVGPADVALLVNEVDATSIVEPLRAAVTSSNPLVRATAARVIGVRDVQPLVEALRSQLGGETDPVAAREEIRTIAWLGRDADIDDAIAASGRWPGSVGGDLALAIARRGGMEAVELYLSKLHSLRGIDRSQFFRLALWGRPALVSVVASRLLAASDAEGWQALLGEMPAQRDRSRCRRAERGGFERLRGHSSRFGLARRPGLCTRSVEDATAARGAVQIAAGGHDRPRTPSDASSSRACSAESVRTMPGGWPGSKLPRPMRSSAARMTRRSIRGLRTESSRRESSAAELSPTRCAMPDQRLARESVTISASTTGSVTQRREGRESRGPAGCCNDRVLDAGRAAGQASPRNC